jgi:D-tagatose-1,6-bisphosphate aldolase subunit GatZ/KbaZ
VAAVERTLDMTREAFRGAGLAGAWERVIAMVVQPGVEFGDATVTGYDHAAASGLTAFVERQPRLVYEAHSTDYQSAEALLQLVEDHFAILKVGPWLTYAFREAVFALEEIEERFLGDREDVERSHLRDVLDQAMVRDPQYWVDYYSGSEEEVKRKRALSFSDRCRYYWPRPEVQAGGGPGGGRPPPPPPPRDHPGRSSPPARRRSAEGGRRSGSRSTRSPGPRGARPRRR